MTEPVYCTKAKPIKLGIRQLVEFSCRSGDLGYEAEPSVAAIDGIRTHQKIQKRYRNQARAEHSLKHKINIDEYEVELGGRVDLLFSDESPPRLEEIKTVYRFNRNVETDYDQRVPSYESWWDVAVAEVSDIEDAREARAEYVEAVKRERDFV